MLDAGFHDVAVGGLGGPLGLCTGLAGDATVGLEAIEMEKKKEGLRLRLKKTPPRGRRRWGNVAKPVRFDNPI